MNNIQTNISASNEDTVPDAAVFINDGICAEQEAALINEPNNREEVPEEYFEPSIEQLARDLLAQDITDAALIFTDEYLDALTYMHEHSLADYLAFKLKAKALKVSPRDLDRIIIQRTKKSKDLDVAETFVDLGRDDINNATVPKGYKLSLTGGTQKISTTRYGSEEIQVCSSPVIITARHVNVDNKHESLELSFFRDGTWRKIIGSRTQVLNKSSLVEFGDLGLPITSETARELVLYLDKYETENINRIPLKKSIARIGWIDDSQFVPFTVDNIVFEEGFGADIYHGLKEYGGYELWKDMMVRLRKNPFARILTTASFASPLLIKMGVRIFIIHLWHDSSSGKSAVLKAGISVWGNPQALWSTANATVVGIEQKAGILRHLPLGIDEKQAADDSKNPLSKLIYMLGEGTGRTRGAKNGGNQETATWHNITIITGEEPITSRSSKDGVQTRTLELNGKPIDDIEFAQDVHRIAENNYGYAGAEFIQKICPMLKDDADFLSKKYTDIYKQLKAKGFTGVHVEYIAALIVVDALVETLIFGMDEATAEKKSFDTGIEILKNNEEQLQSDNIQSAYDFIIGWTASNEYCFNEGSAPCYGKKEVLASGKTAYYIFPHIMEQELRNAGYNAEKIIHGFDERGYLYVRHESGKKRRKVRTSINGNRTDMYRLYLSSKDPEPEQLSIDGLVPVENAETLSF